ncbi:hypothetical protein JQ553_32680 [Bradyrhizobium lablabi]|nr:hypothetical protein [Bradyrhizobium lablabi]
MTSSQLDELFANSPPGDIPDGEGRGTALIVEATPIAPLIASFVSHFAWQGKIFDARAGLLKNMISPLGIAAIVAKVYKAESWFDGRECIVLDYSETSIVAGWIRDEIRMIEPAIYLGQVFAGRTRLFHFALHF